MLNKLFFVLFTTLILKINFISVLEVKNEILADSSANYRIKRQGDIPLCLHPVIPNGNINILSQKSNSNAPATSYLLLNVTCQHNFILYPPNNNIILCINGFWDRDIPQCIQCGQRLDNTHKPFIVNGSLSKFGDFPWHIGIYKKEKSNSHPVYKCGGSIINENAILTVAHCFTDESGKIISSEYYVAAGKYYSNYNSANDKYAQKRKIDLINVHPRYKGYFSNYAWDIAVIFVDEPFEISNLVQPICVDWTSDFENEQLIPNSYGEIAGWGSTETNLDAPSLELRVLKVPYVRAENCASLVPKSFIRYITPDKFCAGYTNGSSVCGGDSGGGLVFQREENSRFYIRGLVSVGVQIDGRCDDYKYSTYTKVSEYLSFVRETLNTKLVATTPSFTLEATTNSLKTKGHLPCLTPNGEQTKCVPIHDCQIFLDALQSNPTEETKKYMRDSRCDNADSIKVCCGSTVNYLSVIFSNPVTTKPLVHRNLNLLPAPGACGRQVRLRQGRILGGNATTLLDFPWLGLLEFGSKEESTGLLCACTLINDRYVLTVAHCVDDKIISSKGSAFRVRLGEYNINTEIDCVNLKEGTGNLPNDKTCADPPLNIEIEKKIIHPLFGNSPQSIKNDIALIRLSKKIEYTDFIKPICLPLNGETSSPGKQMTIAGWGSTESGTRSPVKRKAFVPKVSDEACAKIYKEKANIQLESSHVCAGGIGGIDSCAGDTGGPLMSTLTNSQDIYAEGIISFGPKICGKNDFPGVASKVSEYMEWILDNIEP